ncbi:MAG: hypothetical protein KDH92_08155 [Chloroflexi bacterium]|nr:hypothetical protein [Chloroflexota bacterium]
MTPIESSVDTTIDRAQLRAKTYWYEDGIVDIGVAAVFLMLGALFLVESLTPLGSAWRGLSAFGLPVVTIGGFFVARWLVGRLKARFTYPRTGLVDYEPVSRGQRRASSLVAALTAFVIALLVARADVDSWLPALQGIAIGAFLLRMAQMARVGRYTAMAACSVALGVLASAAGFDASLGSGIYFGGLGICLLVSGLLALRGYLHAAPSPDAAEVLG